jgi:hypothetical protein
VALGGFRDERQERYLADTLIARRDKVVAAYFRKLNPLDGFRVEGTPGAARLAFENLGEAAGLARATGYEHEWFVFDNLTGGRRPQGTPGTTRERAVPLPPAGDAVYLVVRLRTTSAEPAWRQAVDVYLKDGAVVGIEREGGHTGRVMP